MPLRSALEWEGGAGGGVEGASSKVVHLTEGSWPHVLSFTHASCTQRSCLGCGERGGGRRFDAQALPLGIEAAEGLTARSQASRGVPADAPAKRDGVRHLGHSAWAISSPWCGRA